MYMVQPYGPTYNFLLRKDKMWKRKMLFLLYAVRLVTVSSRIIDNNK